MGTRCDVENLCLFDSGRYDLCVVRDRERDGLSKVCRLFVLRSRPGIEVWRSA
jgi:hypothetical protein